MSSNFDSVRRSTSATLKEIAAGEKKFKEQHGVDIADECDWLELRDIVARIERRLMAKLPAKEAAE